MSVENRRVKITFNQNALKEIMKIIRMILGRMVTPTRVEITKQRRKNGTKLNS